MMTTITTTTTSMTITTTTTSMTITTTTTTSMRTTLTTVTTTTTMTITTTTSIRTAFTSTTTTTSTSATTTTSTTKTTTYDSASYFSVCWFARICSFSFSFLSRRNQSFFAVYISSHIAYKRIKMFTLEKWYIQDKQYLRNLPFRTTIYKYRSINKFMGNNDSISGHSISGCLDIRTHDLITGHSISGFLISGCWVSLNNRFDKPGLYLENIYLFIGREVTSVLHISVVCALRASATKWCFDFEQ